MNGSPGNLLRSTPSDEAARSRQRRVLSGAIHAADTVDKGRFRVDDANLSTPSPLRAGWQKRLRVGSVSRQNILNSCNACLWRARIDGCLRDDRYPEFLPSGLVWWTKRFSSQSKMPGSAGIRTKQRPRPSLLPKELEPSNSAWTRLRSVESCRRRVRLRRRVRRTEQPQGLSFYAQLALSRLVRRELARCCS